MSLQLKQRVAQLESGLKSDTDKTFERMFYNWSNYGLPFYGGLFTDRCLEAELSDLKADLPDLWAEVVWFCLMAKQHCERIYGR